MCRIMRAGIDATGFLMVVTQIARSCFYARAGDLASWHYRVVEFHRKRVQIDVAIRAIARAEAAADAPVFDNNFQRVPPADRSHRATDHAQGIAALAAGSGHQIFVEPHAFANQAAHAVMCVRTGAHALIATGAAVEVEHEKTLSFHQPIGQELINGNVLDLGCA